MDQGNRRRREVQPSGPGKKARAGVSVPAEVKKQPKEKKKEKKDNHLAWDGATNNHAKSEEGYGCLWRHTIAKSGWESDPCNYPLNGFYACAEGEKKELFTRDFLAQAKGLGYLDRDSKMTGSASGRVQSGAQEAVDSGQRRRETLDVNKYIRQAKYELRWLARDKGWHINVCPDPEPNHRHKKNQPNFYPMKSKTEGGFGAWYPYEHNYHHLIPIGAVEEWVVGKGGAGGVSRSERVIKTVLMSRWNIHDRMNMILLPQQEIAAEIVGLPAHCPWGVPEHVEYQSSLKAKLRNLRSQIDESIGTGDHPVPAQLKLDFDEISKELFEKVKAMKPGKRLSAVKF